MIAFIYAVLRLVTFADASSREPARVRQIEIDAMTEALAANVCAVMLMAGAMIGLASIFVHLIRFIQAHGAGF